MAGREHESRDMTVSFAEALRAAITTRGLALSRLRDRLAVRGHRVSVATLSYWQSGRSQPERAVSLEALTVLEEILGVPPSSLRTRLDAPRPRGRRQVAPLGMDTAQIVQGWEELDRQARSNLAAVRRMSIHLLMTVHADRTAVIEGRAVGRVHAESADRVSVYLGQSSSSRRPPEIRARRGCSLGTVHTSPAGDAIIAEMMLPEEMPRGSTFTLEYELRTHQSETTTNTLVETYRSGQTVVGVSFDPDALPRTVTLSETGAAGEHSSTPLELRRDGSVLVSRQDFGPGRLGIEWEW